MNNKIFSNDDFSKEFNELSGQPQRAPPEIIADKKWESSGFIQNRIWALGEWIQVNKTTIRTKEELIVQLDEEIESCASKEEKRKLMKEKIELLESLSINLKERHAVNIGPLPTLSFINNFLQDSIPISNEHTSTIVSSYYSKYYGGYYGGGPNADEWWTSFWNPYDAYIANTKANQALKKTQEKFPSGGHNDDADAYRHALWNCLMARQIGASEAKKFGDAHENYDGNPENEKEMDLHNNKKGRDLATDPESVLGPPPAGERWQDKECSELVEKALNEGKLQTSPR
ncbi:DUF6973 domain-containing protein [Nitrosopumilus ureiphilus]|uniref:DUF6973 domain-containing protein n=1 Tax=Nitrosopumilus ureiphilus TaxID=1470067 RepID=A0A7D5R6H8_9ARCH|nr:hypothetical protein [Nitrosopumilus ureiphilus]QLH06079.1 hypothetical protein C5F50_02545 [Nitrosopumilus ureiphilus]